MQQRRLEGAIAIVTGGAQGFGKTIVETFIEHGARIVVMDLSFSQDGPMDIKGASPNTAIQLKANVCDLGDWKRAVGGTR